MKTWYFKRDWYEEALGKLWFEDMQGYRLPEVSEETFIGFVTLNLN